MNSTFSMSVLMSASRNLNSQIVKRPSIVHDMRTLSLVLGRLLGPNVAPAAAGFKGVIVHLSSHALFAATAHVAAIEVLHVQCLSDDQARENGKAYEVGFQSFSVLWCLMGFVELGTDDLEVKI